MITRIALENYKAFGESVEIPIRPITLLYGENSAGKSSILQALVLLKQSYQDMSKDRILTLRGKNAICDFGSFQDLIYDHDISRSLSIDIQYSMDAFSSPPSRWEKTVEFLASMGTEIVSSDPERADDAEAFVLLDERESDAGKVEDEGGGVVVLDDEDSGTVTNICIAFRRASVDAPVLFQYSLSDDRKNCDVIWAPSRFDSFEDCLHPANVGISKVELNSDSPLWADLYENAVENREMIAVHLRLLIKKLREGWWICPVHDGRKVEFEDRRDNLDWDVSAETKEPTIQLFEKYAVFYESQFSLAAYIDLQQSALERIGLVYDPQLLPCSYYHRDTPPPDILCIENAHACGRLGDVDLVYDKVGRFLQERIDGLRSELGRCVYISPLRQPPSRIYSFDGFSGDVVGASGEALPHILFKDQNVVARINGWLDKLGVEYHLRVNPVADRARELYELRVVDQRRPHGSDVALADVGFGISQIMPIVAQSILSFRNTILIEQPEVHVHPKLQAEMGDLFVEGIGGQYLNRFIIETHSEHLMLRLQKRIRQGRLDAQDVSVLYVERAGDGGSRVTPLRLDKKGNFVDEWPGGFFEDDFWEMFEDGEE